MILVLRLTVLCMVPSWLWLGVDVDCIVYGSQLVMAWCWGCLYVCGYQLVTAWCWGLYVCGYQLVTAWCWGCMCMVTSWLQFGVEADCIVYGYQLVRAWCWGWPVSVLAVTLSGRGSAPTDYQLVTALCWNWPVSAVTLSARGPAPADYSFVLKLTCFSCQT